MRDPLTHIPVLSTRIRSVDPAARMIVLDKVDVPDTLPKIILLLPVVIDEPAL